MDRPTHRALTAAALISAAVVTAGCSGSPVGTTAASPSATSTRASTAPTGKPTPAPALTRAQLAKAALGQKDVPRGWTVRPSDSAESFFGSTDPVNPASCRVITEVGPEDAPVKPTAVVDRMLTDGSYRFSIRIAAYAPGAAEKIFTKSKEAVANCPSFTSKASGTLARIALTTENAPALGDDAVAFKGEATEGSHSAVMNYTEVRVGSAVALFGILNVIDPAKGEPAPQAIVAAQVAKLQASSKS